MRHFLVHAAVVGLRFADLLAQGFTEAFGRAVWRAGMSPFDDAAVCGPIWSCGIDGVEVTFGIRR
jgi:hypothetical protein